MLARICGYVISTTSFIWKDPGLPGTHLQVKKGAVLREIEFAAPQEAQPSSVYETGAPGRPSSMHLVKQEFAARYQRHENGNHDAKKLMLLRIGFVPRTRWPHQ